MSNEKEDRTWYWGECSQQLVDDYIEQSCNGTFLVYKPLGCMDLTLVYRFKGNTKTVNIYHKEGFYGFTEPLGFVSLDDALDAYNMSPTITGNTLIFPAVKPGTNPGAVDARTSLSVEEQLSLLRAIKHDVKLMEEKDEELEMLAKQNTLLDQKLDDIRCLIESLNRVLNTLKTQMKKHHESTKPLTTTTKMATLISDNFMRLTSRINDISKELEQTEIEKCQLETDYVTTSKRLTDLYYIQQDLQKQIFTNKRVLIQCSPENAEFVESIISRNSREYVDITVPQSARESIIRDSLLATDDGSFIVRRNSSSVDAPFTVFVTYTGQVYKFKIFERDKYYGLNPKMCVFDDIQELVEHYTYKPLGIHDAKMGNLRLQKQLILRQSQRNSRASNISDN